MEVHFWGVRGSIAVSGARYARAGGNTTCVEIRSGQDRLILDGGTGLRALGEAVGFSPLRATVLFTHLHWDHIQGVPFFTPAFHPDSDITIASVGLGDQLARETLAAQMRPPTFPVGLETLRGVKRFLDFPANRPFAVGPFRVTSQSQCHPDGVACFRVEADGRAVVFATDVEHGESLDEGLVSLAHGADLLIHDAQYTPAEYEGRAGPPRIGWGHSRWTEAVEVARRAGVGQVALFHHDPQRDDDALAVIESEARHLFEPTFAAREGQSVAL